MNGALEPGQQFAGYGVEALLGRGGMGEVYLAQHLTMGRRAALKVLAPELAGDQEFRQRFLRECQIAAQLEHPNIIPIHDAGEVDGRLYIAMRYVQGTDLRSLIRSGDPPKPERVFTLLWQVADALDAAHAQGVVHRDVKPANILVENDQTERTGAPGTGEHVYLCDFGLGVRADAASQLTTTGETLGTAAYMAPEQAYGQPADARTDTYALGCVLFECLTGRPPFRGDTVVATIAGHLHAPVPALSAARPDLDTELDAVFERALAKTPTDRYPSCGALLTAVQQAAGHGVGMVGAPVWGLDGPSWAEDTGTSAARAAPGWEEDTGSSAAGAAPGDVFVRYAPSAKTPSVTPGRSQPPGREEEHRRKVHRLLMAGGLGLATLALAAAGTLTVRMNSSDRTLSAASNTATTTTLAPTTAAPTTTAPPTTAAPATAAQAAPAPVEPPPTEAPPDTEPPHTEPPDTEPPAPDPPDTEPPTTEQADDPPEPPDNNDCVSGWKTPSQRKPARDAIRRANDVRGKLSIEDIRTFTNQKGTVRYWYVRISDGPDESVRGRWLVRREDGKKGRVVSSAPYGSAGMKGFDADRLPRNLHGCLDGT